MTYRDELDAAHARIAGLDQQLASAQPVRESEALRERSGELETVKQALAAQRSLTANSQASREAQLEAERAVTAAHAAKAEALLNATERALEVRIEVAVQERQQAEESLEELASLSRAAALRLYQERLALVHADRARLVAESVAAGPRPAEGASIDEQVRYEMARRVVERNQKQDAQLVEHEARLARLCAILEQPPRA